MWCPHGPFPTNLTRKKQRPILWSVEKRIYHQLLPYCSNMNYCSCLISMKEFLFWATSIYLKCSILSVSVDLAKKSKFYEIQAAVLQSAYKAQCIAVARSSNSTQTTSPVHLRAPLAQLQQVFCQLASQKTSSSAQLLVRPQKRQRLLTRKVSKQELLARDRHLYNLKPTL